jgi:hypothetical protein
MQNFDSDNWKIFRAIKNNDIEKEVMAFLLVELFEYFWIPVPT